MHTNQICLHLRIYSRCVRLALSTPWESRQMYLNSCTHKVIATTKYSLTVGHSTVFRKFACGSMLKAQLTAGIATNKCT